MGTKAWTILQHMKWHHWARAIAVLVLLDQWLGPIGSIPPSEAIVVVCLGAIFAPIPDRKAKDE